MRLVSRRRCAVGVGMRDCLARAARVPAAGGAFSRAASLVLDLVLRAGAVAGTGVGTGTDIMRRLRRIIGLGRMGMCAVVGTSRGAGVGVMGMSLAMDRVTRRVGSQVVSTLGTVCTLGTGCGIGVLCTLGTGCVVVWLLSVWWLALSILEAMRVISRMSCSASLCVNPVMSAAQSARAFMSLS